MLSHAHVVENYTLGKREIPNEKESESTNSTSTNRHTASKKSLNILTYAERNYLPFFRSITMYNSNTIERHDKEKNILLELLNLK